MERDIDAEEGLCGIAMDASYPNFYKYVHQPNAGGKTSYSISLVHLLCKLCLTFACIMSFFPLELVGIE